MNPRRYESGPVLERPIIRHESRPFPFLSSGCRITLKSRPGSYFSIVFSLFHIAVKDILPVRSARVAAHGQVDEFLQPFKTPPTQGMFHATGIVRPGFRGYFKDVGQEAKKGFMTAAHLPGDAGALRRQVYITVAFVSYQPGVNQLLERPINTRLLDPDCLAEMTRPGLSSPKALDRPSHSSFSPETLEANEK
jgi:hypothetical protein